MIHRAMTKSTEELAQIPWVKDCICGYVLEMLVHTQGEVFIINLLYQTVDLLICLKCRREVGVVKGVIDIRKMAFIPFDILDIEEGEYEEVRTAEQPTKLHEPGTR